MYTVEPYKAEIRLISNLNGLIEVYPDYESFLDSLTYEFIEKHIVTTFKEWPLGMWWLGCKLGELRYERFVVRDEFGSIFSSTEIYNDFRERRAETHRSKWTKWWNRIYEFVYRQTPVPRTGKRVRGFHCWYRTPKTTQERRWSFAHGKYVRGKRRAHILPNTWDDKPRGDIHNRKCWKNKKIKKQWMKNLGRF